MPASRSTLTSTVASSLHVTSALGTPSTESLSKRGRRCVEQVEKLMDMVLSAITADDQPHGYCVTLNDDEGEPI